LVFGRYVAGAGILLPMLAGAFGVARRRAYALLVAGSVAYVVPWGALAFYLGQRFQPLAERFSRELVLLAIAGILGVVVWFAYRRVRRNANKAALHGARGAARSRPPNRP
jgi:membrane protein DedA with SNARE-associated domain